VVDFKKATVTDADYFFKFDGTTSTPPPNPKDPPVTDAYYFLIVRANTPPAPALTKVIADPAWETLRGQGHGVKDVTVKEAADKYNVTLPSGSPVLPVVVFLKEGATRSTVEKIVSLPSTSQAILDLPKGGK
jgi:hypothetical protein